MNQRRELLFSFYADDFTGAPALRRYTLFGNHFAASSGDEIFRLDCHPTMRQHPTTPMRESDLRIHLSQQTTKTIALMNIGDVSYEIITPPPESESQKRRERPRSAV